MERNMVDQREGVSKEPEYIRIDSFAPSVDWENEYLIEGEIIEKKNIEIGDRTAQCVIIRTSEEDKTVWISVGLKVLLGLDIGTKVRIKCMGFKKSPYTKRNFRAFEVYLIR